MVSYTPRSAPRLRGTRGHTMRLLHTRHGDSGGGFPEEENPDPTREKIVQVGGQHLPVREHEKIVGRRRRRTLRRRSAGRVRWLTSVCRHLRRVFRLLREGRQRARMAVPMSRARSLRRFGGDRSRVEVEKLRRWPISGSPHRRRDKAEPN